MVQAHIKYLNFHLFLTTVDEKKFQKDNLKQILLDLARVYALKSLIEDCGPVFASGFFISAALTNMKQAFDLVIKRIRP